MITLMDLTLYARRYTLHAQTNHYMDIIVRIDPRYESEVVQQLRVWNTHPRTNLEITRMPQAK